MGDGMKLCDILLNAVNKILSTAQGELEDVGQQEEDEQLQDAQPLFFPVEDVEMKEEEEDDV